jgi:hypothetical protein
MVTARKGKTAHRIFPARWMKDLGASFSRRSGLLDRSKEPK